MTIKTSNYSIRLYEEKDFPAIHQLNEKEGWTNLAAKQGETRSAWRHSQIAFVAERDGSVIGCLRGLTDGCISLYICELLVAEKERGSGIGQALLAHVHALYPKTRMELLASANSKAFYEKQQFRPFYGFRKTWKE
ncbi:putative acetyltransferase [Planococcus massiliensis]|uniref:Putative acetyltransferase n=1 Tax=Planococcus massiliensis TaxID=1499687 RepID=A0A098EG90_9BACL|nr:GNAT family N-acetyltransferase [Planococcus massiliensis]CEG21319.1 putative acetyltransferase [Planococcus massiliensis]